MSHIVSFDTKQPSPPPVNEIVLQPPQSVLKKAATGKKRGRKSRVYSMTKTEGEFVIHFT